MPACKDWHFVISDIIYGLKRRHSNWIQALWIKLSMKSTFESHDIDITSADSGIWLLKNLRTYSCGHSPGFSPDSLFKPYLEKYGSP